MTIHDDENVLTIDGDLNRPAQVGYFSRSCDRIIRERRHTEVLVKVNDMERTFPNTEVPIAAIVDHHRRRGVEFRIDADQWGAFLDAFALEPSEPGDGAKLLSRVWCFDDASAAPLVEQLADEVARRMSFAEGAEPAFRWSLREAMDNVIRHSGVGRGFVEVQAHPHRDRVAVCVADQGVGLWHALESWEDAPETELHALARAIAERAPDESGAGRAGGLRALCLVVTETDGWMSITSGKSGIQLKKGYTPRLTSTGFAVDQQWRGTCIDFQMNSSAPLPADGIWATLAAERSAS